MAPPMAVSVLDLSNLELNPKEVNDFSKFIVEKVMRRPELTQYAMITEGITMKQKVVFASLLGKTGLKGNADCARQTSGAESAFSEKEYNPVLIEDTLIHCNAKLEPLFKAYFDKIQTAREIFEIEGSDLQVFVALLVAESILKTVDRAVWFGDKAVAASGVATAGLVDAANVKFYDYINGFWQQIFAGVTANDIERVTISENAQAAKADQLDLAPSRSVEIFNAMWAKAPTLLRQQEAIKIQVSREIFDNYENHLISKGENFTIDYTQEGLPSLRWKGKEVINMESVWDNDAREDFEATDAGLAYYRPNRVIMTVPENLGIGTLNSEDFATIEFFYEKKERQSYIGYGFTIDAVLKLENMIVVAY